MMYHDLFTCRDDVCSRFNVQFEGSILYARYENEDYEGHAIVIFVSGGMFYLVSANHCSCNGLEGLWEPEELTVDMMKRLSDSGGFFGNACKAVLALLSEYGIDNETADHIATYMRLKHG